MTHTQAPPAEARSAVAPLATRPKHVDRRDLVVVLCLLPLVLALALLLWRSAFSATMQGDTRDVVRGAQGVVDCVREHRFTGCDAHHPVGYRALLQYIPAIPLRAIGLSEDATLHVLIVLNGVALAATVVGVWIGAARNRRVWAPVLAAVVMTGPLLWYATVAFSEALGAAALVFAVLAVLTRKHPGVVAAAVALACLGKETNFPFVVALAALCLFAVPRAALARAALGIAVGVAAGILVTVAFDYFRYASLLNTVEFKSIYQVHDHAVQANFFTALWVAPNAGIAWFWPSALAVLLLTAWATGRPWRRPGPEGWRARAGWAVLALLTLDFVGLARWYAPFGWIAWGPRLTLPLVPAMVLVAAVVSGPRPEAVLVRLLHSRWVWLVTAAGAALALPNVGVGWAQRAFAAFFTPVPACGSPHLEVSTSGYYCTTLRATWRRSPVLWHVLDGLREPGGLFLALCVVGSVFGLVVLARRLSANHPALDQTAHAGPSASP